MADVVRYCELPTCGAVLPKSHQGKYCKGTDHYQAHMAHKRQATQQRQADERRMVVASKTTTTTTEHFTSVEERKAVERSEMFSQDAQEQLRDARTEAEKEGPAASVERWMLHWGPLVAVVLIVAAVGVDITVFLIGKDTNVLSMAAVLGMTIAFEGILMLQTLAVRRLRYQIAIAATESKPILEGQMWWAAISWFALAVISAIAQFGALTGASTTVMFSVIGLIVAVRAVGTTAGDFIIALGMPIEVKTPAMVAANLKQEANDLRELAGAYKEKLLAERDVRQLFLEMQQPRVESITEEGQ